MNTVTSSAPAFFRGAWVEPGHPEYDAARWIFNQRVDARPKVIARCAGTADVVAALRHARESGLRIDVRATGYNLGGLGFGEEMIIDLSLMRSVQIVPERRTARIQGGVRGGEIQIEGAIHGLAAVTGGLSETGVGLMLGGGVGLLSTRGGYACDNIRSVELVTATGEVVTASPDENPDLFWAVCGSTGNFGVVTALEIQLHEVPPLIHLGVMSWSLDNLAGPVEALRSSWDWASDDFTLLPALNPASLEGRGGIDMILCHVGTEEQARVEFERLRLFGAPDMEEVSAMPYRDLSFAFNAWYPPARTVCHEQPVTELSDELLDAFVARVREPAGDAIRNIETIPRRGALGRAPEIPTVLRETGEEPTWMVVPVCMWQDESEDESHLRWTEHVYEDICRIGPAVDRARPNTVAVPLDLDGVARLYGDRFERLRGLKRQWDPENVFHGNHNIPPADD